MIQIVRDGAKAYVDLPVLAAQGLVKALTFSLPGAHFIARSYPTANTSRCFATLIKLDNNQRRVVVPFGLKHRVLGWLQEHDFPAQDSAAVCEYPLDYEHLVSEVTLDKIQVEACKLLAARDFCPIELRTGSGKTEIIANLLAMIVKQYPAWKCVVVVPKLALLVDGYKRIKARVPSLSVGKLCSGYRDLDCQVVVATSHSIATGPKTKDREAIWEWRSQLDVVILDEAHHSNAPSWRKVVEIVAPKKVWALSGKLTYLYKDKELKQVELEAILGGPPVIRGANEARLCPVVVVNYKTPSWTNRFAEDMLFPKPVDRTPVTFKNDPQGEWLQGEHRGRDTDNKAPTWMLKQKGSRWYFDKTMVGVYIDRVKQQPHSDYIVYHTVRDICLMEFEARNLTLVKIAKQCSKNGEAFVVSYARTRHGKRLLHLCKKAGLRVKLLAGGMSGEEQHDVITQVTRGELDGLIANFSNISEGVNIPNLIHLIKADGLKEEQILEQQKGRVERAFEGKEFGVVHVLEDSQHPVTKKAASRMVNYYRTIGLEIYEATV